MTSAIKTALLRSATAAAAAVAAWGAVRIGYAMLLCPPHRAWQNVRGGATAVVVSAGERRRRTHDAVFVCETTHHLASFALHRDLDCYCAPDTMPLSEVAARVGGTCVADAPEPELAACREAHCNHYVDGERP